MARAFGGACGPAVFAAGEGFRAGALVAARFAAVTVLAPERFGAAAAALGRFRATGLAARRRTVFRARAAFAAGRFRAADLRAARFRTGFFADFRERPVRPAAFRRLVPAAFRLAIIFPFVT